MLIEINLSIEINSSSKLLKLLFFFFSKLITPRSKDKVSIRHKTVQKFWGYNFAPSAMLNLVL